MKTEKYIVEVEMPDGDSASPLWVKDVLQSDADIEDEGRWKVSVKNGWKPSEEQIKALSHAIDKMAIYYGEHYYNNENHIQLKKLLKQLEAL